MGLTPRRCRRDLLGFRPLRGGKVRALDPFHFAALPSASKRTKATADALLGASSRHQTHLTTTCLSLDLGHSPIIVLAWRSPG